MASCPCSNVEIHPNYQVVARQERGGDRPVRKGGSRQPNPTLGRTSSGATGLASKALVVEASVLRTGMVRSCLRAD